MNDLAEEEAKRDAGLRDLQQIKDKEKEVLVSSLSSGNVKGKKIIGALS